MLRGILDLARLVREQHERAARIAIRGRRAEVLAVAGPLVRGVVVDAGEIEARIAAADRDALVAQIARAEPRDLGDPRVDAGVVLVVAGDREHAVRRATGSASGAMSSRRFSTVPSTRSPVSAIRSGFSAFARSTTRWTNARSIVMPVWRSLSWTIENPSSAFGSFASATSTVTISWSPRASIMPMPTLAPLTAIAAPPPTRVRNSRRDSAPPAGAGRRSALRASHATP